MEKDKKEEVNNVKAITVNDKVIEASSVLQTIENKVKEGDEVIMYGGRDQIHGIKIIKGQILNTKYGAFSHNALIDKLYGSKITSTSGGWLYVLKPTPELWTEGALQHRTQIIYSTDAAAISFHLEIRPGSIVVESGTGSGSLSRALARKVAPTGKLLTYEYHEQRATQARKEFEISGLQNVITVFHRDVCANGFGLPPASVDAFMLDLPAPWEAIPHTIKLLKHWGRICCFSPCIEQVSKTAEKLRELGFQELETIECLLRPYEVRTSIFIDVTAPGS